MGKIGSIIVIIIVIMYIKVKVKEERKIAESVRKNECPRCGSKEIKWHKKGYDYERGYIMSILGIKGSRYIAGFDRNKRCGYCKACGKEWETEEKMY